MAGVRFFFSYASFLCYDCRVVRLQIEKIDFVFASCTLLSLHYCHRLMSDLLGQLVRDPGCSSLGYSSLYLLCEKQMQSTSKNHFILAVSQGFFKFYHSNLYGIESAQKYWRNHEKSKILIKTKLPSPEYHLETALGLQGTVTWHSACESVGV